MGRRETERWKTLLMRNEMGVKSFRRQVMKRAIIEKRLYKDQALPVASLKLGTNRKQYKARRLLSAVELFLQIISRMFVVRKDLLPRRLEKGNLSTRCSYNFATNV